MILANLSGFDGSPESMRRLQLEFGAEIGRAVVNFQGPIVFVRGLALPRRRLRRVLQGAQREHGGVALEGTYASVIGGAPAAAVVFAREVGRAHEEGPARRGRSRRSCGRRPTRTSAGCARGLEEVARAVRSEKLGEVADEFDASTAWSARCGSARSTESSRPRSCVPT